MARLSRLRILVPAAGLALVGHAVAYGSFWPHDGIHGYFAWYQPLFGGATLLAVTGLAALLALGMAGNVPAERLLRGLQGANAGLARGAHRLALTSLTVLLVQETVESSLATGRLVLGAFSGPSLLLLLAFLWLASLALVYAGRGYAALARRVAGLRSIARVREVLRPSSLVALARLRPLAAGRALRAPPLLPA